MLLKEGSLWASEEYWTACVHLEVWQATAQSAHLTAKQDLIKADFMANQRLSHMKVRYPFIPPWISDREIRRVPTVQTPRELTAGAPFCSAHLHLPGVSTALYCNDISPKLEDFIVLDNDIWWYEGFQPHSRTALESGLNARLPFHILY